MVIHAVGGLVVLIAAAVLAVFKPEGRTRAVAGNTAAPIPPWVRVSVWAAGVLLLALLLMVVIGRHGPKMHTGAVPGDLGSGSPRIAA